LQQARPRLLLGFCPQPVAAGAVKHVLKGTYIEGGAVSVAFERRFRDDDHHAATTLTPGPHTVQTLLASDVIIDARNYSATYRIYQP
jgi:hypothetical protein